ncbi:hypothetical protein Pla175_19380 [Pirellulimonas nuda]|uniref:DUF1552 domain-containing protein n=1 Tax=Pirellulimonas nuda TaxID=2528009 RepID=A0A518DAP0_9BACT|nr:DUF1552 domain-containing protein [Pirellulimonas nuda]QDU88560.1 hypothetical protein Pla175_19380 [Pirellulimonas nuda]
MKYAPACLTNRPLDRRTLLRGLGVSLALPWLEAMSPALARGAAAARPQRFVWVYIPNGVAQDAWHPTRDGRDWEMTRSLEPLAEFRDDINIYTGLDREFRGGTGVHAQAGCCWLTSSPPTEALDGGFSTNRTVDQMIARRIGGATLLPSLELSCNDHANQKETKYFETISWHGPGYAAGPQKDPREVFRRLFGRPKPITKSVLDVILEDAQSLSRKLGADDQGKLDEYLESVRSAEVRIERAERRAANGKAAPIQEPTGVPEERGAYIRLMEDLIALSFQQDLTRVATLVIDPERWDTPRMYDGVFDSPENHHVLTHTKGEEAKEKLRKIDRFHVEQFAHLVKRLKATPEGDGNLLDNSLVFLGSGMGDGRIHNYNDVPLVTAGKAGVGLRTGYHHKYSGKVPLANLWLSVLQVAGIEQKKFADSTGVVSL